MNLKARLAAQHLQAGGVISHPTDTIQSLTCLPNFKHSISKILQLKCRPMTKGLILLASELDYFANFVADFSSLKTIKNTNQPTTYLLQASEQAPILLTGEFHTVAVRLTNNPLITQLCNATRSALISTSANISGKQCAQSILDLKIAFGEGLDFIIPPKVYNSKPSRIVNGQTGERLR